MGKAKAFQSTINYLPSTGKWQVASVLPGVSWVLETRQRADAQPLKSVDSRWLSVDRGEPPDVATIKCPKPSMTILCELIIYRN